MAARWTPVRQFLIEIACYRLSERMATTSNNYFDATAFAVKVNNLE